MSARLHSRMLVTARSCSCGSPLPRANCFVAGYRVVDRLCGAVVLAGYSARHLIGKGYTHNPFSQVVQSLLYSGLFVLAMPSHFRYQFKQSMREASGDHINTTRESID